MAVNTRTIYLDEAKVLTKGQPYAYVKEMIQLFAVAMAWPDIRGPLEQVYVMPTFEQVNAEQINFDKDHPDKTIRELCKAIDKQDT
ncbi:hypothetical protein L5515_017557 [Caenorhabditis briggsae]|uniref:Uncharacterized protein n=1 Tax=Caenorhabditis briggsae TaxID=6238 RepID=A0AAE9JSS4_CAEBR|nr:hypothetical protein L5515_017557 [Caenorhabditis briggsae]